MQQMIGAIILMIVYLFLFGLFGQAFFYVCKVKTKSVIQLIIVGFFVYFSLFQVFALPLKVKLASLSTLSTLWCIVVIAVVIFTIVILHEQSGTIIKSMGKEIKDNFIPIVLIAIIILVQLIMIEYNDGVGSAWDSSYYIGEVTSSIYTNTLAQYDAYTGRILSTLNSGYLLENYQMHSAVVCYITKLHPLLEIRTTMTAVVLILSNMIYFKIGTALFPKKYSNAALMLLFMAVINFCYCSVYSASSFFYNRTFEGKTILGSVIAPIIIYLFIVILKNKNGDKYWPAIFAVVFGTYCLNMSALFLVPVMLAAFFIPLAIAQKSLLILRNLGICLLPCVAVGIYYAMSSSGHWIVYIN